MSLLLAATWGRMLTDGIGEWVVHGLSVICLIQYVLYTLRVANTTRDLSIAQKHLAEVEDELQSARRERSIAKQENHLLRGFVGNSDPKRAVQGLLKNLIPNSEKGFAGYIELHPEGPQLTTKFGWDLESETDYQIPEQILSRLSNGEYVQLTDRDLPRCGLFGWFTPAQKRLLTELYFFPIRTKSELFAVLITTHLMPAGASQTQQTELLNRLLEVVAITAERVRKFEDHRQQLRWTSDMLELHAMADMKYSTPVQMIQVFLENLVRMTGSDRGSLYFISQGLLRTDHEPLTPWVTAGESLQVGVRNVRGQLESYLIEEYQDATELTVLGRDKLKQIPAGDLVGGFLLIPLVHNSTVIGVICLSRNTAEEYVGTNEQLAAWAGEFLSTRIVRTINQANVEKEARQDGLTGLANRRTFDQSIARELATAAQTGTECSLIMLDLDRFKLVNDNYGHPAGDQVLRRAAQILREQTQKIRNSDRILCARYGGEEMAVLLPGVGLAGALRIAESIRLAIEHQPIQLEQSVLHVTASSGIACFPQHGSNSEELIAAADSGLYAAKENGRNRVEIPQGSRIIAD
jgi:diguanylate cyclase (GGDEF)-like protein